MNKIKELFIENADKKVPVELPRQLPKPEIMNSNTVNSSSHKKNSLFFPQHINSLFWCAFISFHGIVEYELIQQKYSNQELAENG